jgi:hypothetical protein
VTPTIHLVPPLPRLDSQFGMTDPTPKMTSVPSSIAQETSTSSMEPHPANHPHCQLHIPRSRPTSRPPWLTHLSRHIRHLSQRTNDQLARRCQTKFCPRSKFPAGQTHGSEVIGKGVSSRKKETPHQSPHPCKWCAQFVPLAKALKNQVRQRIELPSGVTNPARLTRRSDGELVSARASARTYGDQEDDSVRALGAHAHHSP